MMKQCPDESFAKKNVLAYLEQIPFYCNQLTVNAKVQTDDQCLPGILNLIETSRNLMKTVVCTVEFYVAMYALQPMWPVWKICAK